MGDFERTEKLLVKENKLREVSIFKTSGSLKVY